MKAKRTFPIIVLFAVLFGCTPYHEVISSQDKSFNVKIRKILIITQFPKYWHPGAYTGTDPVTNRAITKFETKDEAYERNLSDYRKVFTERFSEAGVTCAFHFPTGLELDDTDIKRELKRNKPDAVLLVEMANGSGGWKSLMGSGIDLAFVNPESGKFIWKANVKMDPNYFFGGSKAISKILIDDIFDNTKPKDGPGWFTIPEKNK